MRSTEPLRPSGFTTTSGGRCKGVVVRGAGGACADGGGGDGRGGDGGDGLAVATTGSAPPARIGGGGATPSPSARGALPSLLPAQPISPGTS
jgi:hypothetical protein